MSENDKHIALQKFRKYYEKADFDIPEISAREFGIGNIKKIDARHLAFPTTDLFRSYLVSNTPFYVSHSTGHYDRPDATPIERKGWRGADLVFDLDMHVEEKYGAYPILHKIKEDAIKIVENFLIPDFGISAKDIRFVFSGNRGYHIHVRDGNYFTLGSDERRELVDYIRGIGLNYRNFFEKEEIKKNIFRIKGPTPYGGGYRGRFARSVLKVLDSVPSQIAKKFENEKEKESFKSGISEGIWSKTSVKDIIERLEHVAKELPLQSVDADAGVTYDTSKLIRVPNSIHGETGLIAKIISSIDSFDPLKDALISDNSQITIELIEDVPQLEIADSTLGPFKKGDKKALLHSIALFYVLKGSATFLS